ncbi:hypothetical protein [Rhizobium pisi]|uniref:hypothetical protein n=1 Tax=Rhizobium pisi TaxID=574561 RepID=UPI003D082EAC
MANSIYFTGKIIRRALGDSSTTAGIVPPPQDEPELDFMSIFGQSRLARISYAVLLLLMFCFDFAKDPIQRLIMAEHDQAARELMAPRPANSKGTAVGGVVSGKDMPLMFKGQEELVKRIAASGRKPTDMQNLRALAVNPWQKPVPMARPPV